MMAIVMTVAITVVPVQAATYPTSQGQVVMLKSKISSLKSKGYSMDYEEMLYSVIERFYNTYIPADTAKGIDANVLAYEKNAVAEIYEELKSSLEAYEKGTKTPKTVTRTNMQNISVNGKYIYDGNNPVFSIGYGFFGHAQNDIPNFQKFGANNIQMEIGPHQTWGQGSIGWNIYTGANSPNASGTIVTGTAHSGSKSLHMMQNYGEGAELYIAAERTIPCKPNTTYTMGVWAKGTSANTWTLWMKFGWDVPANERTNFALTSNWKEYTNTYTTGANQTTMTLLVLADNTADAYLDDFYVYEQGSNENLLPNGGLEAQIYPELEGLKVNLKKAQENNVGVSLLLAPHYLENIAAENDIPLTSDDQATFIRFDINHTKAKEIIEAHIRGVLSNVKDYTCIDSICISNEPWFDTRWFTDYQDDFQNYAIEKHGSLANAKSAYGQYLGNTIKMPETSLFGNYTINAKAYDWMEFNDKVFTEWHQWMAGIVREYFPNTPIHSKVMENIITTGETKERVELSRGTDYDLFGTFSDYSGIDGSNYTTDDYYEMMFLYDYLQSSVGKPVYNSETHIIEDYGWSNPQCFDFTSTNTDKALYKMWQGAIHGRSMSTVWAWQRHYTDGDDATTAEISVPSSDSNKAFYGGLLFRPDLVAGLGKMNLDLARLGSKIVELQENSNKVAVLYSKPSRLWNASHITSVLAVYKQLITNGYDVGVVTERSIEKLSDYDTLVIPANTEYTTQATRTAVENFASAGGKVLLAESDGITKNEYNKSLTTSTINGSATYSLSALNEKSVTLKDTSTGAAPQNVEWQYSEKDGRLLINIANNSEAAKNIDVYYNGSKLVGGTELISEENGISTVALSGYEPKLMEYSLITCGPDEVANLEVDNENSKIIWAAYGKNISGLNIYKVGADKSVTYLANVTGKEYAYPTNGTYLVSPVLKDGTELEGKFITTLADVDMTVRKNGERVSVGLTNNGTDYLRAKVFVEALKDGEVVSYGYSKTFVTPGGKNEITLLLSTSNGVDDIRVTVYDDINNILVKK